MKFVTGYIFRSICMLMIGLLLVLNPNTPSLIIRVIAALFVVAGMVSVFHYLIMRFSRDAIVRPVFPLAGLGSVCLGLLLGRNPDSFISLLMYFLGGLMLVIGISHFFTIMSQRAIAPLRWWLFLIPVALIGCGITVIAFPMESATLPFIILGGCCIAHGISELFYGLRLAVYQRQQARAQRNQQQGTPLQGADIEDAEIIG